MKLKDLCSFLDTEIPLAFQEDYDNSGLQIGLPENEVNSALLTLDITEDVIEEAIKKGCDIILSHHPLIFHGIKKLTGKNFTERVLIKAIKHDLSIYSSHTNLDAYSQGVSRKMAEKIGLTGIRTLSPLEKALLKLVTFIPVSHFEKVRDAIFEAGAGVIGNYDNCGFAVNGTGSFRGNDNSEPFVGEKGKLHIENEVRFETILYSHQKEKILKALLLAHPYEEVAYDFYSLENNNIEQGFGCIGNLPEPADEKSFLNMVAMVFGAKGLRHSGLTGKKLSRIALCGGSGSFLTGKAIGEGADVFVTADLKYHDYFQAENQILLVDPGHFESEKFSVEILNDLLIKKFPKFAVRFSEINTNPINYF